MPTNLYFNNVTSNTEQDLINDLTSEVIQIHGMDVFYIPRIIVKEDLLLGEDVLSKFGSTGRVYEIEMYLKSTEGLVVKVIWLVSLVWMFVMKLFLQFIKIDLI